MTNAFIWDTGASQLLADSTHDYVYLQGSVTPDLQINLTTGTVDLLIQDQNANTRGVVQVVGTNSTFDGTIVNYTDYDAYGNAITQSGGSINPGAMSNGGVSTDISTSFAFGAGYWDTSNLTYLVHRYLDNEVGQFISVDPLVDQTREAYVYAGDGPVMAIDALGGCTSFKLTSSSMSGWNQTNFAKGTCQGQNFCKAKAVLCMEQGHDRTQPDTVQEDKFGIAPMALTRAWSVDDPNPGVKPWQLTPAQFAVSILRALGKPIKSSNINFFIAWARAEGGNWRNTFDFNVLNTKQRECGRSAPTNSFPSYPSLACGVKAVKDTLKSNSAYSLVLSDLSSNNGATASRDIAKTPWDKNAPENYVSQYWLGGYMSKWR